MIRDGERAFQAEGTVYVRAQTSQRTLGCEEKRESQRDSNWEDGKGVPGENKDRTVRCGGARRPQ